MTDREESPEAHYDAQDVDFGDDQEDNFVNAAGVRESDYPPPQSAPEKESKQEASSPAPTVKEAAPGPVTPAGSGPQPPQPAFSIGGGGSTAGVSTSGDQEMRTIGASPSLGATSQTALNVPAPSAGGSGAGTAVCDTHTDVNAMLSVPDWIRLHPLLGAYLAECLGTFVFVLTVALVEINNPVVDGAKDTNISSIPIGFMFMCLVLTFGYISGGHFNPCVTLAVFMYERANMWRYLMYLVCQCGAALGAGIVAMIIKGDEGIIVPDVDNDSDNLRKAFFAELVISFALCTVVLNVAHRRQEPSLYSGMAMGMVVTAGVASVGGVSGGAFNPALATGLQLAVCFVGRCTPLIHFYVYWLAPAAGAFLSAVVFSNLAQPTKDQLPGVAPTAPADQRIA